MAVPAVLRIDIIADAKKAAGAFDQVSGKAGGFRKFADTASNVMFGAVGAIGAVGLATVKSAEEAAAGTAGLEQVFSQMGDTTGTAADAAIAYAEAMSKKIGVDDDAIIAAQTQLATFGAVSDETARAAGVFDRATSAAADLAAAGFGSMDTNAVQLGKALQDPVKGLAALKKSGVDFTDAQKEQIAAMVEAGDVTKAQELILANIERQVGGTAEATATASDKMNVAFGETQEAIGTALLPAFQTIATVITDTLLPALQPMLDFFQEHSSIILPLAGVLLGVAIALKVVAVAQGIWNLVMLASPLTWIVLGIVALIAAIVLLIANAKKVEAFMDRVWSNITKAVGRAFDTIKATVTRVWQAISSAISGIITGIRDKWDAVVAWFLGLKDRVVGFFASALNWLISAGRNIVGGLFDGLKAAWETVAGWLGGFLGRVVGFYANAGRWLYDIGRRIIEGLWDGLKDMWSNVTGWFSGLGDQIADLKGPPSRDARLLVNAGRLIMGGLQSGLETGWGGVAGYLSSRQFAVGGIVGAAGARGSGGSTNYTLNISPRTADARDVAWGFRRLELARGARGG